MDLRNNELRWALAAVFIFFGLVMVVGDLSSNGLAALIASETSGEMTPIIGPWLVGGLVLAIVGALFGAIAFVASKSAAHSTIEEQLAGYDTALLGLAFALVLLGILNFVALAGFATAGELKAILVANEASADPGDGIRNMMRMLLMPGFAALGSLFFVAGALRVKRQKLEEEMESPPPAGTSGTGTGNDIHFNGLKFWGGLWYRMGEAVLFALVFFLAIASEYIKIEGANRVWILLLALLLGMFVKPAEQLVNGLAMRLFDGVKAMLK